MPRERTCSGAATRATRSTSCSPGRSPSRTAPSGGASWSRCAARGVNALEPHARAGLARALGAIGAPDALILVAGEAEGLADRRLERRGAREWVIEPGRGGRPRDVVRGTSSAAALARLARAVAGGQIGLALGAGGAYGFAHLGVARV